MSVCVLVLISSCGFTGIYALDNFLTGCSDFLESCYYRGVSRCVIAILQCELGACYWTKTNRSGLVSVEHLLSFCCLLFYRYIVWDYSTIGSIALGCTIHLSPITRESVQLESPHLTSFSRTLNEYNLKLLLICYSNGQQFCRSLLKRKKEL